VRVSVDGPSRLNRDRGVQEVPIELHGFQHPVGAYEGALTLPGSTQAIKLKLTAKDAWWCAVIALLLGILLALLTQLWNGRWQPRGALEERAEQLWTRYGTKPVPGHALVEIDCNKLGEYVDGVKQAIARYSASVVMFDTTSDAYRAIDASLKLAEEDAAVFTGAAGLKLALDQLEAQAKATTNMLSCVQVTDVPEILKAASKLLGDEELGVGGATKRQKASEELLPVLAAWCEVAKDLLEYVVWLKALTYKKPMVSKVKLVEDLTDAGVLHIGVKMSGLRVLLFQAKNASDVDAFRSSASLWSTLNRIAYLGTQWEIPQPSRSVPDSLPLDRDDNIDLTKIGGLELKDIGYASAEGEALTFEKTLEEPVGVVIEPAQPAELPERKLLRIAGDWLVLGVTILVSIVAGLSTFYFTKSFGTFTDYLTVIVIGAAAQTLLKGVLNQTSILLHDIVPSSPVVPAKIAGVAS
jgi:hypothetical protein